METVKLELPLSIALIVIGILCIVLGYIYWPLVIVGFILFFIGVYIILKKPETRRGRQVKW